MRSRLKGLAFVLALTIFAILDTHPEAAGRVVSLRTDDGRVISAMLMEASQRPAPAVVLVPMLGRPKEDWQAIAGRFAEANITTLAIDLPQSGLPADPKALVTWHTDIGAAIGYLAARADIRPGAIGVAGASLGANLAAVAASGDARVRALALVSPSLDYRGVRLEGPMRQYGGRPALLIASARDPYAARTVRALGEGAPGTRETRWAELQAHGTVLLAQEPDLVRAMIEWFQRTLQVQ